MADKIAVQRVVQNQNGTSTTVYYDAYTNQQIPDASGYVLINEATFNSGKFDPSKPIAIPRVIRNEADGMNRTIWVDSKTGAEVNDLTKYNPLDEFNSNVAEIGAVRVVSPQQQQQANTNAAQGLANEPHHAWQNDDPISYNMVHGGQNTQTKPKDMVNNFGYINRPDAVNYAGLLGGPAGLVAKGVNVALNANNTDAVSRAQKTLGFTNDQNRLGQYLTDKKGYIGDLHYNDVDTSVGFEAKDNIGRTTLTPNEARNRQLLNGARQSTEEEQTRNVNLFKDENPGLLGKAKNLIDSFLGRKAPPAAPSQTRQTGVYTGPTYTNVPKGGEPKYKDPMVSAYADPSRPDLGPSGPTPIRTVGFTAQQTKDRYNTFSDKDKAVMGATLAGEIDFSKTDLSTPEGIREANGILSTIENRVPKYGSIQDAAFADNQYSTWNTEQVGQTAISNYKSKKGQIDSLVEKYVSNPDNNLGFTSYYNPSIANPAWGSDMTNRTNTGPHVFGNITDYGDNPYSNPMAKLGVLNPLENDRALRAKPTEPVSGLNTPAKTAYKSLDTWYSGPKGVVGPAKGSTKVVEDRALRAPNQTISPRPATTGFSEDRTDRARSQAPSAPKTKQTVSAPKSTPSVSTKQTTQKSTGFTEDRTDRAKTKSTSSSGSKSTSKSGSSRF